MLVVVDRFGHVSRTSAHRLVRASIRATPPWLRGPACTNDLVWGGHRCAMNAEFSDVSVVMWDSRCTSSLAVKVEGARSRDEGNDDGGLLHRVLLLGLSGFPVSLRRGSLPCCGKGEPGGGGARRSTQKCHEGERSNVRGTMAPSWRQSYCGTRDSAHCAAGQHAEFLAACYSLKTSGSRVMESNPSEDMVSIRQ
jgi:hypothetical protein